VPWQKRSWIHPRYDVSVNHEVQTKMIYRFHVFFFFGFPYMLFHRRIYPLENSHGTPRMRFGWRFCSTKNQQKSEDLQAMFLSLVGIFCFRIFFVMSHN
jgi:hypothetical protein